MTDSTHEELLHREIDGENAPEESAGLRRLTAARPDLRESYEALRRLVTDLGSLGEVEPPPGLALDVMQAIRNKATAPRPSVGWLRVLSTAFAWRPTLGHAFSLAAGLLVGALAVGLAGPSRLSSRLDGPSAAGTILPSGRLTSLRAIDRQEISEGGVRGEAVTRLAEGRLLAEVRIESGGPVDVTLEFDPAAFWPVGFEQDGTSLGEAVLGPGRLRLSQIGAGRCLLILGSSGSARPKVRLTLEAAGGLFKRDLRTGDGE